MGFEDIGVGIAPEAAIIGQYAPGIAQAKGAMFQTLGKNLIDSAMADSKAATIERNKIAAEGRADKRATAKEGRADERVLGKEQRATDSAIATRDEQREYNLTEETRKGVLADTEREETRKRQIGYLNDPTSPEAKKNKISTDKSSAELENKREDTRLKKAKADAGGFAGKAGKATSKKYKNEDGSPMTMEAVKENRQVWKEENRDRYDKGEVKELVIGLKADYEDALKDVDVDGIDYFNKDKVKEAKSALKTEYEEQLDKIKSGKQLTFDEYMKGVDSDAITPKTKKKKYTYTKKN